MPKKSSSRKTQSANDNLLEALLLEVGGEAFQVKPALLKEAVDCVLATDDYADAIHTNIEGILALALAEVAEED